MAYTIVIVLTVIVAILLIGVVLIQKSKGGGLASGFSGANQIMGVRHTNDFIEKTTWVLGAIVAVLAIVSTFVMPRGNAEEVRVKAPATPQEVQATPNQEAQAEQTLNVTDETVKATEDATTAAEAQPSTENATPTPAPAQK